MGNIKEEIRSFINNRLWITKKSRMEAEARMNRNHLYTGILVNYYTFWVLAFSIWTLVSNDKNLSLLTVIASVGLFGISIFIGAIGYREKALQYKTSYLSLTELEFELKYLINSKKYEDGELYKEFYKLEKKYTEILTKSENHNDVDYWKVLMKHNGKITSKERKIYKLYQYSYYFLYSILFAAPIILSIVYRGL